MNEFFTPEISASDIVLSKEEILSAMGFRGNAPAPIVSTLESILPEALSLLAPKAGCRIVPAETGEGTVTVGGLVFETRKIISSALKGSDRVAVFAATIGPALEARAAAWSEEGQTLRMYIGDVIASEAVEKTIGFMQTKLAESLSAEGLSITNRYSPGYCGWDVSSQNALFSLLPDSFSGVTVTASSMMRPVKSVSGFIGIGAGVALRPYGCALCDKADCIRRS